MKVLLLTGGSSNEREISLRSGKTISNALDHLGYDYEKADPGDPAFNLVSSTKGFDVVFLALHGKGYEDGKIQKQLEVLPIPFTGSGSVASKLCFDKWNYKNFLFSNGLPASFGQLVSLHQLDTTLFKKPYVLKPRDGGSSLDLQIVRDPDESTRQASKVLLETYDEMLMESLVDGVEITVGIFGDKAFPVIEIIPPSGLEFDYANKYNGLTQELCPPLHVSNDVQDQAKALSLKIHKLAGCRDISRTDIMVDKNNELHILETNITPGLTAQSLLPKMLFTGGISMPEFVKRLLNMAISRQL